MNKKISRRDFFKLTSGLVLAQSALDINCAFSVPDTKGKLVMATNNSFLQADNKINQNLVSSYIHKSLSKLLDAGSPEKAWSMLFNPHDKVGIKVNCLASPRLSPHPEVIAAIVEGLKWAGISEENILVWDRSDAELERGKFKINASGKGLKCFGTDAIENGGYEPELSYSGALASCFSMILTKFCTALINVPVIKDHDISGVGVAMKNLYGVIHNPNKYHDNSCNPYLADLCNHPQIKEKLRLIICDGILAQYNGGPSYKPQWTWNLNTLMVSQDIVAIDRMAYKIIEEKRKMAGMPALKDEKREPLWLKTAAQYGLGIEDITKIKIIIA